MRPTISAGTDISDLFNKYGVIESRLSATGRDTKRPRIKLKLGLLLFIFTTLTANSSSYNCSKYFGCNKETGPLGYPKSDRFPTRFKCRAVTVDGTINKHQSKC